jgi:hypothetical protein
VIEKIQKHPVITVPVPLSPAMNDSEDAQRWIRLKRYETPGEEYFGVFLEQFKERQRAELLRSSARCLLCERFATWYSELGTFRWAAPIGAAAAVVATGAYFALSSPSSPSFEEQIARTVDLPRTTPGTEEESLEDVITLQIPRTEMRVPGLGTGRPAETGVVPAGAREGYREL